MKTVFVFTIGLLFTRIKITVGATLQHQFVSFQSYQDRFV